MKVFALRGYGSADQLHLADRPTPVPGPGEALVQVRATSVNPYDWHGMRGEPRVARLLPGLLGLRAPRFDVLGADVAGRVEAVGAGVTGVAPGDDVYGLLTGGGFGEYVSVPADLLAPKPANLSYEQAAAVPMAGITALVALRDSGRLEPGQRVLVNGASGGVGTFTVQLAKALGATVTGVCGPHNVELVRSLGADEVVDYRATDFTRTGRRYDLLVDNAGGRTAFACRRVLDRRGRMVVVGGPAGRWLQPAAHVFGAVLAGPLVSRRVLVADAVGCEDKRQALATLTEFIEAGRVTPVVHRSFPFAELPAAVSYQEQGHASGKVVVTR